MGFNFSRWSLGALFHYKSKVRGEPVTSHRVSNPYHAVSVVPGAKACQQARKMIEQRFLSSDAPQLPLPGCSLVSCTCRYEHHPDRRSEDPRRESDIRVVTMDGAWRGVDRRVKRGRRITDR